MKSSCLISLAFFTACAMGTAARAETITVTSTSAWADAAAGSQNCSMLNAFLATCSASAANGSGSAVAAVLSGHLGAFAGADSGFVSSIAQIIVGLAVSGAADTDVLEIDYSLDGTFSNGGATASLEVDDGNSSILSFSSIVCGSGQVQYHGVPCVPTGVQQIVIPLANQDTLFLAMTLQPELGKYPSFADFLNSADYTIKLPPGTTLINNPGGTLFETGQAIAVPEPSALILMGTCMAGLLTLARRRPRGASAMRERCTRT